MDEAGLTRVTAILTEAKQELRDYADYLYTYMYAACELLKDTPIDFRLRQIEEVRIKEPESVGRSLDVQNLAPEDVWQVDDMVGGRIIVGSPSDVDPLIKAIRDDPQKLGPLTVSLVENSTGYRAHHLKGWYVGTGKSVGCEIQIRTALQDAWAFWSRADLYHGAQVTEIMLAIAAIQSRHLAAIDETFELVRSGMKPPPPPDTHVEPKALSSI